MKRTYFISDLHLGATYEPQARQKEQRVVEWLEGIVGDAEQLYLLGDILDYWYEYRTVVPRGYVRFFGALARLADAGVKITWFTGNHDIWLFDYLRDEIGIEIVDGSRIATIGDITFFLAHGDGVGRLPRSFKFLRGLFRNRVCQRLYSAIHPRWTVPMALRWSSSSRKKEPASFPFQGENESLIIFAREELMRNPGINCFVFGHRHLAVDCMLTESCQLIILGDWIENYTYAVTDGRTVELRSLSSKPIIREVNIGGEDNL